MLIPAGYGQVNIRFGGLAAPRGAEVTFGVDLSSAVGTLSVLAQNISNAFDTRLMTQVSSVLSHTTTMLKVGPNATGPFVEVPGGGNGTQAATAVPPNVAVLCTKITAQGGRAGRGRCYLPGLPEGSVDASGIITPSIVTNITAAWNLFLNDLAVTNVAPMVLLHGEDSPATLPFPVTAMQCQARVATQRDRLR